MLEDEVANEVDNEEELEGGALPEEAPQMTTTTLYQTIEATIGLDQKARETGGVVEAEEGDADVAVETSTPRQAIVNKMRPQSNHPLNLVG
jgi:hypothetical protein